MTAIDIEKTILFNLMACNVPESAIEIRRAKDRDIVTVSVHAPHGTKVRDYSAFQLLNANPYIVDEVVSIADWYHGVIVPVEAPQTPWQRMWQDFVGCWSATPRFIRVGLTLLVILLSSKLAGFYK